MSWHKVKVGDFLIRVKDLIQIEKDKEYSLVTIKLYHKGVQLRKREFGSNISADKMSRVKSGQFILSGIDARNGAFGIIPPELDGAVVTNDFWHFDIDERIVSKEYFLWLTSTPYFDDICNKASDGTTNRIRLQADRFYTQELFIPDIDNQHEVVEELKKQGNKIDSLKKEYSYQLTQLENLNQAILQEAVQGKLVPQDPNDEPASELLKRIKAEKAKSGKKEKPLAPIKPEEIPFEIPENWVWCRLGEICNNITKGSSPNWQGVQYVSEGEGILFITSKNVDSFKIDLTKATYVEEKFNEIEPRSILKQGDILTNIVGASIGRTALFDLDVVANINQAVCILRIEHSFINKAYLLNLMNSNLALKLMSDNSFAPGRANLSMGDIANFPIPLPPLSEQKRIVAEIEKQLAKTKQLKEHIIANQQATEQLLKALLHQAFLPAGAKAQAGEVREVTESVIT